MTRKMLAEEKELHDRILELFCRWADAAPQSYLGKIKVLIRAVRADERGRCAKVAEKELMSPAGMFVAKAIRRKEGR